MHFGYWGPSWHPIGFLVATLAVTAIVVSVANSKKSYFYDQGVYYEKVSSGYTVVPAPVGATVSPLPKNAVQVDVSDQTYYYYGCDFYAPAGSKYKVVSPPVGAVVSSVRDGTNTVVKNGNTISSTPTPTTRPSPPVVRSCTKWLPCQRNSRHGMV